MPSVKVVICAIAFAAAPLLAAAQQPTTLDQVVERIVSQEQSEMQSLRQYSPLVETYIQNLRPDKDLGTVPDGDKYFLGRAELAKGVELASFTDDADSSGLKHKMAGLFSMSMEYVPRGFLQMIYVDTNGFNRQNYKFDYVRREFLGEVRCLVFDVTPTSRASKGRFLGRIWVEDRDFHIVRFNGGFTGESTSSYFFHFDSWRVNAGPNLWLPAFIYSEENDVHYGLNKKLMFKAQTRLWGYDLGQTKQQEELSKVLVEAATPVNDQTEGGNDLSPIEAQRTWDRQAEDNVVDRMERLGLLAPRGEVDKVLETVINNLEVTNNLDVQPEVRCRVLMTSTLESFTIGHTIVMSRGLIDVLADEASLAAILSHELGHVVLGHRIDSQYAFFDRLLFDDKDTFHHFGFARTPDEEQAADQKGMQLLRNSPYKDQLSTPRLFMQALQARSSEIPNLISPHLGDRVLAISPVVAVSSSSAAALASGPAQMASSVIVALPLGGRIKMDPWNDHLEMMKSKPVGTVAEREKMPFEVTPFVLYLTRLQPRSTVTKPDENPRSASEVSVPESGGNAH